MHELETLLDPSIISEKEIKESENEIKKSRIVQLLGIKQKRMRKGSRRPGDLSEDIEREYIRHGVALLYQLAWMDPGCMTPPLISPSLTA
jgi:hypothetical protein